MTDQATHLRGLIDKSREVTSVAQDEPFPRSVPTGIVSYGPPPPSQRSIHRSTRKRVQLARSIAITSGKGGVGKSNLAVNLAVTMSGLGLKVCLLDADLGLANADVLCNVTPRFTLQHVVTGRCRLSDAMLFAPGGFRLIPGASGVAGMANLDTRRRHALLQQLAILESDVDVILIDCGAGISTNVLSFAAAAHSVVVVTTPEPTAMTDGYGMIKTLLRQSPRSQVELVVNMASSYEEAKYVYDRINHVSQVFLKRTLGFAGAVPLDGSVSIAVRQRLPFVLHAPDAPVTQALRYLSRQILGLDEAQQSRLDEGEGFFVRMLSWLKLSKKPVG